MKYFWTAYVSFFIPIIGMGLWFHWGQEWLYVMVPMVALGWIGIVFTFEL